MIAEKMTSRRFMIAVLGVASLTYLSYHMKSEGIADNIAIIVMSIAGANAIEAFAPLFKKNSKADPS